METSGALQCVRDSTSSTLWSAGLLLEHPELLIDAHAQFLAAGADIVTSSSYQLTFEGIAGIGGADGRQRAEELFRESTAVARTACAGYPTARVAASLGCYGAHLADGSEYTACGYRGVGVSRLQAFHKDKLTVLLATNPDSVAFETVPCVDEAKAIAALLTDREVLHRGGGSPVAWVSLACSSPDTLNGCEPLEDALRALEDPDDGGSGGGAALSVADVAVGVNCTDPRHVRAILQTMRDTCRRGRVLVAYPNLGETWEQQAPSSSGEAEVATWKPVAGTGVAEAEFVRMARQWHDGGDGATIIGGCCRVAPPLIAKLKSALTGESEFIIT